MFGQLQNRYPNKLSEEIVGNCDTKIDTGTNDVLTAEYFCSLMGVSTVETTSIRKHNSLEGDIEDYGQKNISTLKRNLSKTTKTPTARSMSPGRGATTVKSGISPKTGGRR